MGRRSWFTVVETVDQWNRFLAALKVNPQSDGISYVALMKKEVVRFGGKVVVAWQGDGDGSLYQKMPDEFRGRGSILLEDYNDENPRWKGREKENIERFFKDEKAVEEYLSEQVPADTG